MLDNKPVNPIENVAPAALDEVFGSVMRNVYLWMALGLMLTGVIAAFVGFSPLVAIVAGQPLIFFGLMIAEIGVVIWLSRGINSMSVTMATLLFFVYATLNGLTLSILFAVYTLGSISLTFFATAGLFGVMSAKDGSMSFDFTGSYTAVTPHERIEYTLDDGRQVQITFAETAAGVLVTETFETESENPLEMQRDGWQAFMDNFKKYTEGLG